MSELTIVAMGGNSLIDPKRPPTVESQFELTAKAVAPIADLIAQGERIIVTHGNGPQVGFLLLRGELASKTIHRVPLDSLVADTQGSLGYMIQLTLREALAERGVTREIASIVTEVVVDPDDKDFEEPTKPVGKFYSKEEADELAAAHGWNMKEDAHRGYRRVVPSPSPVDILQMPTIQRLVDEDVVVVACGGGGIPVKRSQEGQIRGVEAVIDKDRASALLANLVGAQRLLISTAIDAVYADFMGPNQRALRETNMTEIRALAAEGHFAPGSMRPKMDAALYFLNRGGKECIICEPEALVDALAGGAGTRILPG